MPNPFAYFILFCWPLVVIYLVNKRKIGNGALISLLVAYMFLPAHMAIDLPVLPPLDKFTVTTITILIILLLKKVPIGIGLLSFKYKLIFAVLLISPFITAITNSEPYLFLRPLSLYDGLTNSIVNFLYFLPFFIGLKYFRTREAHQKLFAYFALAAFLYSFLALYEIRMSPQLHQQLYGYFPHSWIQQKRGGGFRAIVFMGHGLLVAMFLAIGVGFWTLLKKNNQKIFRYSLNFGLLICLITLILMKSLGALLMGTLLLLSIYFLKPTQQILLSVIIAIVFITYPFTSATGLFPHEDLYELAATYSEERAGSLKYRFDNEEILLNHANEKPLFGWGGWARSRVFDPETGKDISVTDGYWIIILGKYGWVGFLGTFLFMILPIWTSFRNQKVLRGQDMSVQRSIAAHTLILSIILIDQLPNSSLVDNGLYWLLAGSLLGRLNELDKNRGSAIKNTEIE